jgi:hypothetical protein
MKDIIVCDLDGTLANCEHRVHHVRNKPKNWDAFYAGVLQDKMNSPVMAVLDRFIAYGNPRMGLIFCTGRPERCRTDTVEWLSQHHVYDYELLMRKDGDFRADYVVKQEILDASIPKDRVLFVLDDRQQVVDMWRRNGLTCFQVAPGDF